MLWTTYTVVTYCGYHDYAVETHAVGIRCGNHIHMLWTTSTHDVGNMVVHSICTCYPQHVTHGTWLYIRLGILPDFPKQEVLCEHDELV